MNGNCYPDTTGDDGLTRAFRGSDVGVFPNRCEGGTNLVMMEYMACGQPAIAARSTGQAEVLADDTCIPLEAPQGEVVFEELLEKLEWAYQNRDALRGIGRRGGESMLNFTWAHTAAKLMEVMTAS